MGSSDIQKKSRSHLSRPFYACAALWRSKIITVEPAILLFFFARYLYLPLYEQYYYVSYGSQILQNTSFPFSNGTFCLNSSQVDQYAGNGSYKWVETRSNNLVFYGQIATRVPQIIVSICLGPLSDRIGRKPIIILASVGAVIQGILSIIIVKFQWDPYYFILTNFLAGMTGSFTAILSSGLAYLSDVSSEKWRGMRLGILETVFSIGAGLGFLSTGYWLQFNSCDFIPPLCLYTACNFAIIVYITFCIPESLSRSERKALAARNPKGLKSMLSGIKIFLGLVPRYSAWRLWAASLINNLMALNVSGAVLLAVYFLKCPPFDLNAQMIGLYQGIQAVSRAMTNALLMTVFSAIEVPEAALALIAMLFHSGCDLLTGFSTKIYQVYIVAAFQGLETLSWTSMRTLMSKLVAPEDQGAMFSVLASGEAFFDLVASAIWPNVYNTTINHKLSPGTSFLIMAVVAFTGIPFVILLLVFRREHYYESTESQADSTAAAAAAEVFAEKDRLLHSTGSMTNSNHSNHNSNIIIPAYGSTINTGSINS